MISEKKRVGYGGIIFGINWQRSTGAWRHGIPEAGDPEPHSAGPSTCTSTQLRELLSQTFKIQLL